MNAAASTYPDQLFRKTLCITPRTLTKPQGKVFQGRVFVPRHRVDNNSLRPSIWRWRSYPHGQYVFASRSPQIWAIPKERTGGAGPTYSLHTIAIYNPVVSFMTVAMVREQITALKNVLSQVGHWPPARLSNVGCARET